jgi:hypothetical protein
VLSVVSVVKNTNVESDSASHYITYIWSNGIEQGKTLYLVEWNRARQNLVENRNASIYLAIYKINFIEIKNIIS